MCFASQLLQEADPAHRSIRLGVAGAGPARRLEVLEGRVLIRGAGLETEAAPGDALFAPEGASFLLEGLGDGPARLLADGATVELSAGAALDLA